MRVELSHTTQYGHDRYFPTNLLSEGILWLMHRKSFTLVQVRKLKEIGFTIVISEIDGRLVALETKKKLKDK